MLNHKLTSNTVGSIVAPRLMNDEIGGTMAEYDAANNNAPTKKPNMPGIK